MRDHDPLGSSRGSRGILQEGQVVRQNGGHRHIFMDLPYNSSPIRRATSKRTQPSIRIAISINITVYCLQKLSSTIHHFCMFLRVHTCFWQFFLHRLYNLFHSCFKLHGSLFSGLFAGHLQVQRSPLQFYIILLQIARMRFEFPRWKMLQVVHDLIFPGSMVKC